MNEGKYIELAEKDYGKWGEIPKEYIEKVCEVFKLQAFCAANHPQYDAMGQHIGEIWIDYIWIADVKGAAHGKFVLAAAQMRPTLKYQETVVRAMLIIPANKSYFPNRYFEPVILETDHLIKAMEVTAMMHIIPLATSKPTAEFNLYGQTPHNQVKFSYHGIGIKLTIDPLWQAMLNAATEARKAYNNSEIEAYFEAEKYNPVHDEM